VQSAPYLIIRKEPGLVGNDRYEGYCSELAEMICKEYLDVKYEIRLVGDGVYGEKMHNGTWNGMVGELTNRVGIGATSVRSK